MCNITNHQDLIWFYIVYGDVLNKHMLNISSREETNWTAKTFHLIQVSWKLEISQQLSQLHF